MDRRRSGVGRALGLRKTKRPALPPVKNASWTRNEIDRFILARLEREDLAPSPEADRATLIRRVTLDLTGLPPTPGAVDAFLADRSAQAYEKLVDRLLASPQFGERMAWDWMDAARYADTSGFQGDPERTMWPWRDWVVDAFNANMPYDRFTIEQLAGDLLPDATPSQLLASGFNRNHMHNGEGGRIAEETRVENVFDRVETTATLWLGLTMTCARCHDHKYDPVTMRDYYALYDFFNQTSEEGKGRGGQVAPVMDLSTAEEKARVTEAGKQVTAIVKSIEAFELEKFPRPEGAPCPNPMRSSCRAISTATSPQRNRTSAASTSSWKPWVTSRSAIPSTTTCSRNTSTPCARREAASNNITRVMVMDTIDKPRDTFILVKGSYRDLTDTRITSALPAKFAGAPAPDARLTRLELARWLVSEEIPSPLASP